MSLQFIIDGYNAIHHPAFTRLHPKKIPDPRLALIELIKTKGLAGSHNNKVVIVFDGYPSFESDFSRQNASSAMNIIFSRMVSADEKIKKIIEGTALRNSLVIVSDDKEIRITAKLLGALDMGIEEFITAKDKKPRQQKKEAQKSELNYSQMHQINEELRKLWLR